MSKWLLSLYDDRFERDMTREIKGTKEQAIEAANDLFDRFLSDTDREFDEREDVPAVAIYEIGKPFVVEMADRYFKRLEDNEAFYKEQQERQEREQFERLQKKFGKK